MKIAVIGAGSTYTPELAFELASDRAPAGVELLTLHDIDAERLSVVAAFLRRILSARGVALQVEETTDLDAALRNADFVLTQIRVGGQAGRVLDETIPLKYGCIGQETTGPGGFAMALRAVPVLTGIAQRLLDIAPGAWLVNFANPAGLATEAIQRTGVKCVGLCNIPLTLERAFGGAFGEGTVVESFGLNHLSWVRAIVDPSGTDRLPDVLGWYPEDGDWPRSVIATIGMLPNDYLRYYYRTSYMLEKQRTSVPRAEEVMAIERATLERYADPTLTERPDELSQRGGAWYNACAVGFMRAVAADSGERQVLNVHNAGVLPFLPDDATVEVPCSVDASGAHPLVQAAAPAYASGLMEAVKAYERLTIDAALSGSRKAALQALLAHPLVRDYDVAAPMLDELLAAHAAHLPNFA